MRFLPIAFFLISAAPLFAQEKPQTRDAARKAALKQITLKIDQSGWGSAQHDDLSAVLRSSCSELAVHFGDDSLRQLEPIRIRHGDSGPITHFQRTIRGEVVVLLSSRERFWCQHAYQMAHEFGHILCRYKKGDKTNLWFEESLCELASIFAVRQMAISWETTPPYPNWKDYSKSLNNYADDLIAKYSLPENVSLKSWYQANAETLSKNPTDRALNGKVAVKLLPSFESNPEKWRAIAYLNHGRGEYAQSFKAYLGAWHKNCPDAQKPVALEIGKSFGIIP